MGASESKLEFRKQIYTLATDKEISEDDPFWTTLLTVPANAEEVFNLCPLKELRKAFVNPKNITILIRKLVRRVIEFPTATQSNEEENQLLNALRLLTRIFPLIFELVTDDLETQIFWSDNTGQLFCKSVIDLLFLRGFTIPPLLTQKDQSRVQYIIWNKGIGAPTAPPTSKEELIKRIEVSRLLLAVFSKEMYASSQNTSNFWLREFTSRLDKKAVLGLLCSLINTIGTYDPVGWAALPYNHLLFSDLVEPLVSNCIQILAVLFNYQAESVLVKSDSSESVQSTLSKTELPPSSSKEELNLYVFYLSKLHKDEDLDFLIDGLMRLISNPLEASRVFLPGSTKKVQLLPELLVLMWHLLHTSKKFQMKLSASPSVLVLLNVLIQDSLDALSDPSKLGSLRLNCFMLQVLSQNREFGVQLNQHVDVSILGAHAKHFSMFHYGCWGDLLYLFIYVLLTTNSDAKTAISTLQESYLAIMANVAPLVTNFSAATANKLFTLFNVYSSSKYLLSQERNHNKLFFLLYTLDTIIQYQFAGNSQIVYTFVRNKDKVLALRDLNYERAREGSVKPKVADGIVPSEKALGKQPISSPVAEFLPSYEWFQEWKSRLPIQVLSTLVQHLAPHLEKFCIDNDSVDERNVLEYLSKFTMVGVLPQPHPIIVHQFIYNPTTRKWVTTYEWGTFYMKSLEIGSGAVALIKPSIWAGTNVKLFGVTFK